MKSVPVTPLIVMLSVVNTLAPAPVASRAMKPPLCGKMLEWPYRSGAKLTTDTSDGKLAVKGASWPPSKPW